MGLRIGRNGELVAYTEMLNPSYNIELSINAEMKDVEINIIRTRWVFWVWAVVCAILGHKKQSITGRVCIGLTKENMEWVSFTRQCCGHCGRIFGPTTKELK